MMISSVTDDRVFTPLRAFLLSIVPSGVEVIQTQDNLVPIPKGAFVSMNNIGVRRLSTNRHEYQSNQTKDIWTPVEYSMQVDFYGPDSGEWSFSAQTLFRDSYALDFFPEDIQPLYADDPIQIPLLNA